MVWRRVSTETTKPSEGRQLPCSVTKPSRHGHITWTGVVLPFSHTFLILFPYGRGEEEEEEE